MYEKAQSVLIEMSSVSQVKRRRTHTALIRRYVFSQVEFSLIDVSAKLEDVFEI